MKRLAIVPALLLSTTLSIAQDEQMLFDRNVRDLFNEVFSGELAKDHVIQITRHHRIQGSRGYRAAPQYVIGQLRRYGYSEQDAYIESFRSDGRTTYETWPSPSGWDIESAELRMVEPSNQHLVGYPEIAMSVMTYSNAGDVTAELVSVGSGTHENDYEGKDVKGKIVLATGYGGDVHRLAVLEHGASAVVCYPDIEKGKDHRDLITYTGIWPQPDEIERVKFGHTSDDTPDMVDPVELKRCEIICAATIWYLNNLSDAQGTDLAHLMRANASQRLGRAARVAAKGISFADKKKVGSVWDEAVNTLTHSAEVETEALRSIVAFSGGPSVRQAVSSAVKQLQHHTSSLNDILLSAANERGIKEFKPSTTNDKPDNRIPVRVMRGPIYEKLPEIKLVKEEAAWYESSDFPFSEQARFELVNFCDGKRTVSSICDALGAEFGMIETEDVARYLADLVKVGVMKWNAQ